MFLLLPSLFVSVTTLPVQAPATPSTEPAPEQTIIVTGERLDDFRRALAACLARHCATNEDVDASLTLAEGQFVSGDYEGARRTVRASLRRNHRQAAAFPEPVSDLYRADTRVERHLGRDREAAFSVYRILDALRAGLPQEDYRHFTARLEISEYLLDTGRPERARRELRQLQEVASAAGREDVAAIAELRGLMLDYLVAPYGPAKRRLIEMSGWTDPGRRLIAYGARAALIRIYGTEGNNERANALIAEIARDNDARRMLLFQPRYQLVQQMHGFGDNARAEALYSRGLYTDNLAERLVENMDRKWIDVGFWVQPDGHVDDLQILRQGIGGTAWSAPLLRAIRGRLYSRADRATYRLERYTYTSELHNTGTGTRIAARSPRARVEYFDLMANPPDAPDRPGQPDQPAPGSQPAQGGQPTPVR
jgi:hypothetical protein